MPTYFSNLKKIFNRSGIARIYPSFMKELDFYDDYYSKHSLLTELNSNTDGVFQAVINDLNNRSLFSLEWDINRILSDLTCMSLRTVKVHTTDDRIFCDESNLYYSRVNSYMSSQDIKPILLVWLEFIKKYYIIDGNHRFVAYKQSGRETIDAIILPAKFHIKYMLSEESRMRYRIFHNIAILGGICDGKGQIDDSNYLYQITNNKIGVNFLKRHLCSFLLLVDSVRHRSLK